MGIAKGRCVFVDQVTCDFSPMKQTLQEDIRQIITALQNNLEAIGNEKNCLLGNFEKIKEDFLYVE